MSEYSEDEFRRLSSELDSEDDRMRDVGMEDIEMNDEILVNGNSSNSPELGDAATAAPDDSQSKPFQSIEKENSWEARRLILAIDFGTTFSSVALARVEVGCSDSSITFDSIECIDHYPGVSASSAAIRDSDPTVPTELLYEFQNSTADDTGDTGDAESDNDDAVSLDAYWNPATDEDSDRDQAAVTSAIGTFAARDSQWGWAVKSKIAKAEDIPQGSKHLKNFKLLLDESIHTATIRKQCTQVMKSLKGIKPVDVIADYLSHLLNHVKSRLMLSHDFYQGLNIEFVLCVPTAWTDKACRIMQAALTEAIRRTQLAMLEQGSIKDLFIVAESEAAAAFALDEIQSRSEVRMGESFLLLDCGGGTVDAVTYTIVQTDPTRLKEVVLPEGVSCGSSFLNEKYLERLKDRLKHATIVENDLPLENIIAAKVQEFEVEKRIINILDRQTVFPPLYIHGLQANETLNFKKNKLCLKWKEMYDIFKGCISGVADLMLKQLRAAKEKGINIQKVILIGGFGESPSLKNHLEKVLLQEQNILNQSIELFSPRFVESAVARGAVLRATRKENGPERITRSSYGILCTERYDHSNPRHRRFGVTRDPVDGEYYVKDTIHWILEKGTLVKSKTEIPIESRHTFRVNADKFLCEEVLFVSSHNHPSGFKKSHQANKGAEKAGSIVADLTFLRTDKLIEPRTELNAAGKPYTFYEVAVNLWIIIEGRTMRFEARSPSVPGEVQASTQFCIAASFLPGTA